MSFIIPLFIPHEGCPHACVFCNQRAISGEQQHIDRDMVRQTIRRWLAWKRDHRTCAVAFYGGSFSALPEQRQLELLGAVQPFLARGEVDRIRISTRPDSIDPHRIAMLREHGVTTVELGVQSLDNVVLELAGRGHSSEQAGEAVTLLRQAGCVVGMQLMLGLPGQNFSSLRRTVAKTVALNPDMVRVYPVLVVAGSKLEQLWRQAQFLPISLEKAVLQAAYMKKQFDKASIRVIRMGLQAGESLRRTLLAGPFHPAFGELVHSRIMLGRTRKLLAACGEDDKVQLVIHPRDQSVFRGVRSANLHRLSELGLLSRFSLKTSEHIARYEVRCEFQQ